MMMRTVLASVTAAALALPSGAGLQAPGPGNGPQSSIRSVLDALDHVHACRETAVSPDGRRVVWVEEATGGDGTTAIYVRDVASGEPRRVTAATDGRAHKERGVEWRSNESRSSILIGKRA